MNTDPISSMEDLVVMATTAVFEILQKALQSKVSNTLEKAMASIAGTVTMPSADACCDTVYMELPEVRLPTMTRDDQKRFFSMPPF